jgi:hypothetical protein
MPNEPKRRRNPGAFADHDAEDELLEGAKDGRSPRANAAPRRQQHASEATEGTQGPQESWRNCHTDAAGEPGVAKRRATIPLVRILLKCGSAAGSTWIGGEGR